MLIHRCMFTGCIGAAALMTGVLLHAAFGQEQTTTNPSGAAASPSDLRRQTAAEAAYKSAGCIQCHENTGDPHEKGTVNLGCIDCHGGNAQTSIKERAHIHPRFPEAWRSSGNPVRSYTLLNHESPDFIRFVNPGDLRVAHLACGSCHQDEVMQSKTSMMTHGCMLWGAALYNNGAVPNKHPRYGESYSMHGVPQRLVTSPPPSEFEKKHKGVLEFLDPLPRFEITQPGNILRIFERGGRFRPEIGIPEREEESGRPRARLSIRGLGTENRTDPVFVGLQRTRLLDPTLNFLGTNDHPGDYRSSGCTACHVVYANDRSPIHSGPYAKFGNRGLSANPDPTIPKDEPGHPIAHKFTRAVPSSQCITCHVHPGTNVMNSYLGYMWWDEETDGEHMYPKKQKYPTAEEFVQAAMNNPDEASARGLWSDPKFLANVRDLNPKLKHTQFADFHGHGWVYKAVFKKDRQGNFLDHRGVVIDRPTTTDLMKAIQMPERIQEEHRHKHAAQASGKGTLAGAAGSSERDDVPVHLMDIHLERGMHCVDCHFTQDNHGNGKLYGEVRAAIEIQCIDCHGTVSKYATLRTSGPAAPLKVSGPFYEKGPDTFNGHDLAALRTPFGRRRFEKQGDKIIQNSMVDPALSWTLAQVKDIIDPKHPRYNEKAALAKTVRFDAKGDFAWGDVPADESKLAHCNQNMSCIACHSSWNPSCFGCHLPQKANKKMPGLHNEGDLQRNYVAYNFQTLRDDVYMLARDGDVTGNKIGPARSSCAIHVSSYNQNRDQIYHQQQTISADGMSGIAYSTNVPHTVRGAPAQKNGRAIHPDAYLPGRGETKTCTDCHLSKKNDNNAIMAQLLMQGTGYVNFMGRFAWVAAKDHGLAGVVVTELEEPQAVIGSNLHQLAFPDYFRKHQQHGYKLQHAHEHSGRDIAERVKNPRQKSEVLQVQPRGEYLYAACGPDGLRVFDIAFIDNKSFSERITTAPVSPYGQKFHVPTKHAMAVAAPCTLAPDPTRKQDPANKEPKVHPLYGYLYIADKYEGLILVGAGTLLDGNPTNNFLKRDVTFNPPMLAGRASDGVSDPSLARPANGGGALDGACNVTIVGNYAYVCCDAGLAVVSLEDPTKPAITTIVPIKRPKSVAVQFRYAFVCGEEGITALDVTNLARPVAKALLPMSEAHNIYLARTYAYVAAGGHGLVILDIENPERFRVEQVFNANGLINDLHDVKLGITYVSEFAYLADGKNGLRVVQLTSPETPGNQGFSPRPTPKLIATYRIPDGGHAYSVGRALDRDRAIDESGNQIAVFGRVGARALSLEEQRRMYLREGRAWFVSDDPRDGMYLHGKR